MGFAAFEDADAWRILRDSEGRPAPQGGHVGHAGARHVSITNDNLMNRMWFENANKAGVPIYTSFIKFEDQAHAVAATLNSPTSIALLNTFYHPRTPPGAPLNLTNVVLTNSSRIQVRVATGGGVISRLASFVTLRAFKDPSRHRMMHIETAFATFEPLSLGDSLDGL